MGWSRGTYRARKYPQQVKRIRIGGARVRKGPKGRLLPRAFSDPKISGPKIYMYGVSGLCCPNRAKKFFWLFCCTLTVNLPTDSPMAPAHVQILYNLYNFWPPAGPSAAVVGIFCPVRVLWGRACVFVCVLVAFNFFFFFDFWKWPETSKNALFDPSWLCSFRDILR